MQSLALALTLIGGATPSRAQAPAAAPAAAPDPAFEASKRAWEAMAEADRRAVQDGLIWTGDYKGFVDGEFGRGTRSAIIAYAQRTGLPTDGTIDQRGRAVLAATAALARNAVGFATVRDPKTGVALGLPTKLLPRRVDTPQGSRWASADSSVVIETTLYPPTAGDLPALFEALKATTPQRKVTYRLFKPDFLVVSGEIGKSIFYTRIAKPADQTGPLRGYTLTYPSGAKALDNISIAVANGWVPFPPASGVPTGAAPSSTTSGNSVPGSAPRPAAPAQASTPAVSATGLAVAADKVLTLYARCSDPRVAGRPATVLKRDDESGATLLQVAGLNARPLSLRTGSATVGHPTLSVFLVRKGTGADVDALVAAGVILSPAGTSQRKRLLAPIQAEGQGGPVFDRSGAFVGVAGRTDGPRMVAGIVPQRAWPLIEPASLSTVLSAGGVTSTVDSAGSGPERSAAELAAAVRQSLVPVVCAP